MALIRWGWQCARPQGRRGVGSASAVRRSPPGGDSLDLAWLKDDSAEDGADLPEPAVLAQEAMLELEGALEDLQAILAELGEEVEELV